VQKQEMLQYPIKTSNLKLKQTKLTYLT
jgi:hypothetical protein